MPIEERRAYRRFNIELPVEYKFASFQENTTQTSTLDISANGLKLRVMDRPLMDDEIHLTIDLPETKKVKLAARIVWSKAIEGSSYDVGVHLADTRSEDGKAFMDFYCQQLFNFIEENKDLGPAIV